MIGNDVINVSTVTVTIMSTSQNSLSSQRIPLFSNDVSNESNSIPGGSETDPIVPIPVTIPPDELDSAVLGVPWLAGCVIAVIVLAAVCAVAALIYGYIYYTRIRIRPPGSRYTGRPYGFGHSQPHHHHHHYHPDDKALHDPNGVASTGHERVASTHIFMFKKS